MEKEIQEIKEVKRKKVTLPNFKDIKKVRGTFKNIESPGQPLSFCFKGHWNGPSQSYTLMDGFDYELPEDVVDHLNGANEWKSCTYKKDKWITVEGRETYANPINISSPSVTMPTIARRIGETRNRFMFLRKG